MIPIRLIAKNNKHPIRGGGVGVSKFLLGMNTPSMGGKNDSPDACSGWASQGLSTKIYLQPSHDTGNAIFVVDTAYIYSDTRRTINLY